MPDFLVVFFKRGVGLGAISPPVNSIVQRKQVRTDNALQEFMPTHEMGFFLGAIVLDALFLVRTSRNRFNASRCNIDSRTNHRSADLNGCCRHGNRSIGNSNYRAAITENAD
ncbi:hypothetical protein [Sulfuricella sp.]|uniref:hypothetical protein n=1 Tax=Sulfuricella sp. TaxID=2099377 RepID=UPI002C46DAF0|nr:hypothetical protein [Sulfuricella sp.]HUX62205.1 hypothetical protein [Sulfuricella sp.]